MKKVQIDPATQRRPTSRKQNRSVRIKEQLTQQVEVQVIPAKADMEGYAAAGIPVFPLHWVKQDGNCSCRQGAMCTAKGKHPRIKNWNEEATTDPEKIKSWWSKTPSANIGIPMG